MADEEGMDEERPRKRRTTKFLRSARATLSLERLREGFSHCLSRPRPARPWMPASAGMTTSGVARASPIRP